MLSTSNTSGLKSLSVKYQPKDFEESIKELWEQEKVYSTLNHPPSTIHFPIYLCTLFTVEVYRGVLLLFQDVIWLRYTSSISTIPKLIAHWVLFL